MSEMKEQQQQALFHSTNGTKNEEDLNQFKEPLILQSVAEMTETKVTFNPEVEEITTRKQNGAEGSKLLPPPCWTKYLGVLYTLISVNCFGLNSIIFKKNTHINPLNVTFWCSPVMLTISIFIMIYSKLCEKENILKGVLPLCENKKRIFLLLLRGICGASTVLCMMYALTYLSPSDVRTITTTRVILVLTIGCLFLGEKCAIVPVITAFVAIIGIIIMTRPPILTGEKEFNQNTLIGVITSLGAMSTSTGRMIIVKLLGKSVNVHFSNFLEFLLILLLSAAFAFGLGVFKVLPGKDLLSVSLAGFFFSSAVIIFVLALRREEAGVVALVFTSDVIFVFFWQWVILDIVPDIFSIVGAVLVISGVVFVSLKKWVESLPQDDWRRRKLSFVLR